MSKVTSKLQVTLPKAIAERYGIKAGDQIEFQPAGEVIRIVPATAAMAPLDRETRLRLFDEATKRQQGRDARWTGEVDLPDRGWTREELYEDRGRPR